MDLWWRLSGYRHYELTGADPLRSLRQMSLRCRLEQIRWRDDLRVCFLASDRDRQDLMAIARRLGDRLEPGPVRGFPQLWKTARDAPAAAGFLAVLLALTAWLPTRILFVEVEGNVRVPEARILEGLEESGVSFGVCRRAIRSEQVKNRLLSRIPELSWAGVNTAGCVATVTVRQRRQSEAQPIRPAGDVAAARDGIVTSVTAQRGTPLCEPGQAVKKGQILISGLSDVGRSTVRQAARGEVFADTLTEISAVLPEKTEVRTGQGRCKRRYSLIFGKKRINLYSDSGILYPSCDKMVEAISWTLPGGRQLPVTLLVERYTPVLRRGAVRTRQQAEPLLRAAMLRALQTEAVAMQIRRDQTELSRSDGRWKLAGIVECREMIGRATNGVYLEDDAKDVRSSGECGAG